MADPPANGGHTAAGPGAGPFDAAAVAPQPDGELLEACIVRGEAASAGGAAKKEPVANSTLRALATALRAANPRRMHP